VDARALELALAMTAGGQLTDHALTTELGADGVTFGGEGTLARDI
jgi:hypothetical protein